ncbi:hypothetical protein scyTo_0019748 [Scyliorhinus torazame]|uniref:Fibronectin type-III domain-containing protein n=1 Tax=Scyliorhinus torazame TaxID=75743 RepID=A0A401PQ91_SCYTO|nr:hypothetical protein [Scyliorhinus torazame]
MLIPNPADRVSAEHHIQQWFNSAPVYQKMRAISRLFLDFATANRARGKTKFIVASVQDDSNVGASISLYERGIVVSHCFEPPSQPERPVISGTTHDSVQFQFQPPRYGTGEIAGYRVEYRATQQEEWTTVGTSDKSTSFTISGLQPHQEYQFQYRAVTKAGISPVSESYSVTTLPTNLPGDFSAILNRFKQIETGAAANGVLKGSSNCEKKADSSSQINVMMRAMKTTDSECRYTLEGPKTSDRVQVSAVCGEGGSHEPSDKNKPKRLAEKLCRESTLTANGNPSIYTLPLKKKKLDKDGHRVKCSFGKRTRNHSVKKIMVLGATGAGKTTLINGMINYILGVKWEDNFRYKLIDEGTGRSQAESQTSSITAYELHHREGFQIDYSLTIIDTPGFGDTRGLTRDKLITDQIREFFTSPDGIDQIDAVCFVAQASLARLTQTQKYIFDSILSIFGKDIAENIQILVTFADGQVPPVLEAINVAEVPCPKDKKGFPVHFKFNNSAVFAQRSASGNSANRSSPCDSDEGEGDNFDSMFWKMGSISMQKFFSALTKMETKSLLLTKEVLGERQHLQAAVQGLQPQITAGLTKLEEIRKTKQALNQHQADLDANKDFEYKIKITVPVKLKNRVKDNYITNCQKCHFTCHYPCPILNDDGKKRCAAMDCDGYCTVCPNKCIWNVHFNQKFRFIYETRNEKQTYSELKEKYERASGEKMSQQRILEKLQQEFGDVQDVVLELIEKSSQSILRLEEIALRPNPLSTPDYIDLLIQSEKEEAKSGFMERIQSLNEVKQQAQLIAKVAGKEELLPEQWKEYQAGKERAKERKGVKGRVSNMCQWISDKASQLGEFVDKY